MLTAFFGLIAFLIGQYALSFIMNPILEQSKLRFEIARALTFYANVYSDPSQVTDEERRKAAETLRQLASQLEEKTLAIRWYGLLQRFLSKPTPQEIHEASKELIGLSNMVLSGQQDERGWYRVRRERIVRLLRIKFPIEPVSGQLAKEKAQ